MGDTPKNEGMPNRLHSSELLMLSNNPRVGVLELETDQGPIEIAINRVVAAELSDLLEQFVMEPLLPMRRAD